MNRVELTGRLTRDPEISYSQGGSSIGRFTLAVDRTVKRDNEWVHEADFIRCVAFGRKAEFLEKYFRKGSFAVVTGSIKTGSYEKDGATVYTTDIWVENIEFGGGKSNEESVGAKPDADGFFNLADGIDEEAPFN